MDCDYYHDTWDPRSLSYCSSHRDSEDGVTKYGLTDYEGTISNFADIVKREFTEQDSLQTPRQYCESNFQFKGGLI